ncbi:hypothetical protein D3C80_1802290 [compost metagenome]
MASCGLTQRERIKPPRQKRCRKKYDHDNRASCADLAPCRTRKRAKPPEGQITQLSIIRNIDESASGSTCQSAKRDTSQKHRCDRGASAPRRHAIKDKRGYQATKKCSERQGVKTEQQIKRSKCCSTQDNH